MSEGRIQVENKEEADAALSNWYVLCSLPSC